MIKHKENCLRINDKQSIKLKDGSIEFKSYFKQLAAPFKIYADFETLLKEIQSSDKNNSSYTEKVQDRIPCSFACKVDCIDKNLAKKLFFTEAKMQFIDSLKQFLKKEDIAKK